MPLPLKGRHEGRVSPTRPPSSGGGGAAGGHHGTALPPSAPSVLAWGRQLVMNRSAAKVHHHHDGAHAAHDAEPFAPPSGGVEVRAGRHAAGHQQHQHRGGHRAHEVQQHPPVQHASDPPSSAQQGSYRRQSRSVSPGGEDEAYDQHSHPSTQYQQQQHRHHHHHHHQQQQHRQFQDPSSATSAPDEAAKLKGVLENVVKELEDTEQELRASQREVRERGARVRDLEEEGTRLVQELRSVADVKDRLASDLSQAAGKIRLYESNESAVSEKITTLERDELLAGTVVVRLSEHITAVEEVTVQSRTQLQHAVRDLASLLSDLHAFHASNFGAPGDDPLAGITLPEVPEPVEDQYRLLSTYAQVLPALVKRVGLQWSGIKAGTDRLAVTLSEQEGALAAERHKVEEVAEQLEAVELEREILTEDVEQKQEAVVQLTKRMESTVALVDSTEARLLALVRESEAEVNGLQVRIDALTEESQELRKSAADSGKEIVRLTEAKERAEAMRDREREEQERLSEMVKKGREATDDKEGTVMSLETQLRQLHVNEERLTGEINKLHTLRIEKERSLQLLTQQVAETDSALNTLQGEHCTLQTQLSEASMMLKQRERDLAASQQSVSDLRGKLAARTDEVAALSTNVEGLQAALRKTEESERKNAKEATYYRTILLNKDPAAGEQPASSQAAAPCEDADQRKKDVAAMLKSDTEPPPRQVQGGGGGGGGGGGAVVGEKPGDASLLGTVKMLNFDALPTHSAGKGGGGAGGGGGGVRCVSPPRMHEGGSLSTILEVPPEPHLQHGYAPQVGHDGSFVHAPPGNMDASTAAAADTLLLQQSERLNTPPRAAPVRVKQYWPPADLQFQAQLGSQPQPQQHSQSQPQMHHLQPQAQQAQQQQFHQQQPQQQYHQQQQQQQQHQQQHPQQHHQHPQQQQQQSPFNLHPSSIVQAQPLPSHLSGGSAGEGDYQTRLQDMTKRLKSVLSVDQYPPTDNLPTRSDSGLPTGGTSSSSPPMRFPMQWGGASASPNNPAPFGSDAGYVPPSQQWVQR